MKRVLVCLAALLFVPSVPASADTFTFDTIPLGTTTLFSSTSSGPTNASFSSPDGPVFVVASSFFSTLTGRVLIDGDLAMHALDIVFSQPLQSVSLLFALNSTSLSSTLNLQALLGVNSVGSTSATGTIPGGFVSPEGSVSFGGGVFDRIRLTSTARDFAIDTINATPTSGATAPVPEPATLSLIVGGLAVLAISRRPRSRA